MGSPNLVSTLNQTTLERSRGPRCRSHLEKGHLSLLLPGLSKKLDTGWGSSCESDCPHTGPGAGAGAGSSSELGAPVGMQVLPCFHYLKTACTAKCGSMLPCLTGNDLSYSHSWHGFHSPLSSCTLTLPPHTSPFLLFSSAWRPLVSFSLLFFFFYIILLFLWNLFFSMFSYWQCDSGYPHRLSGGGQVLSNSFPLCLNSLNFPAK